MLDVLFVDDEENILRAIRRCLKHLDGEWRMHFANGGQEALDFLEHTNCDVIVCDMIMPHMGGEEVLSHVKERYPQMARIVLSGQCNQATAFRLVGSDHLYLAKPCPSNLLIDTIKNACFIGKKAELEDVSTQELKDVLVGLSKALLMHGVLNLSELPNEVKMFLPASTLQAYAPIIDKPKGLHTQRASPATFASWSKEVEERDKSPNTPYSWEDYFNTS
ncbi:response regulator [Terasakiella pusilla]|uniref:response regulator n=1 Tax=Terasakiella pusilla TaxID=64973 RepID=UPI003AA9DAFF